jgi:hypothetical protein
VDLDALVKNTRESALRIVRMPQAAEPADAE